MLNTQDFTFYKEEQTIEVSLCQNSGVTDSAGEFSLTVKRPNVSEMFFFNGMVEVIKLDSNGPTISVEFWNEFDPSLNEYYEANEAMLEQTLKYAYNLFECIIADPKLKFKEVMVKDLLVGQVFKLSSKASRMYTINKIMPLEGHDHIKPVGSKILVISDNCKQITLLKDQTVFLNQTVIIL